MNYESQILFPETACLRLCILAEQHAFNAGQPGHIKAFTSGVTPRNPDSYPADNVILAIDFGGTVVKCIAVKTTGDKLGLEHIASADLSSRDLTLAEAQHSIATTVSGIINKLGFSVDQKKATRAVSITYSQAAMLVPFSDGSASGYTAVVPDYFTGGIKKEGFMASVRPGDDIGRICLGAFRQAGFTNIQVLRCDNDTISTAMAPISKQFVFKDSALPLKVSGVVASTGANFTVYTGPSKSEIANSEGGNEFKIPDEFLTPHLKNGFKLIGVNQLSLERLSGRINLAEQFFIEADFNPAAKSAAWVRSFSADDRKKIFSHKSAAKFVELIVKLEVHALHALLKEFEINSVPQLSAEELTDLNKIATTIGKRSTQACALMCYTSAANCLDDANFIVNLDASMAGIFPDFVKDTLSYVDSYVAGRQRKGQIFVNHMPPEGNLSVPMRGGIRTACEQLSRN